MLTYQLNFLIQSAAAFFGETNKILNGSLETAHHNQNIYDIFVLHQNSKHELNQMAKLSACLNIMCPKSSKIVYLTVKLVFIKPPNMS